MSASAASPRPCPVPTSHFDKMPHALVEDMIRLADTATAIRLYLFRNTLGWNRTWYLTSVSALAREMERSLSQVKDKLTELVKQGLVLKEKVDGGGFRLALADPQHHPQSEAKQDKPKPKPKEPKKGLWKTLKSHCGKL